MVQNFVAMHKIVSSFMYMCVLVCTGECFVMGEQEVASCHH